MDFTNKEFFKNYDALLDKFSHPLPGAPEPFEYVVEECSELIQAIQHYKRAYAGTDLKKQGKTYEEVIEEMAHVYTLMDAARIYHDIESGIIQYYQQKLIDRYLDQPNDGRHIE